jgi:Arc/MetJ-type ribon-helix-helix transcriptional regulator
MLSDMDKTTLRLPPGTLDEIDDEVEEEGYQSRADYLRAIIESRHEATEQRAEYEAKLSEYEERLDRADSEAAEHRGKVAAEYEEQIEGLEQEIDRLNRERRQLLEQREENQELMEYVGDEQRFRQAGLFQRFKWWFTGMD